MSEESPAVSVGICVLFFLRIEQTLECIEHLLPSGLPIYILNNGSSRESREQLARAFQGHAQVMVFDSERNLGVAAGRNYLISRTTDEWLLMLDNDIIVTSPTWPDTFWMHLSRCVDTEVFVPRLFDRHRDRDYNLTSVNIRRNKLIYTRSRGGSVNRFPGGCAFVSRRLFERLGMYDEEMFVGYEDIELAIRALRSKSPIRARVMSDMEFVHDHRPAVTLEEQMAALERYRTSHIEASYRRFAEKHGLSHDPHCADWSKAQLRQILDLDGSLVYDVTQRMSRWFKRRRLDRAASA